MDSLLRWSIENSATDGSGPTLPPEPRQDLDPGIIDAILGKPDAALMKEALAIGMDSSLDVDARVMALDDLEMLVEQIDNAMNLTPLQMYPKILSLLSPNIPDAVRMQSLWILGTAVQNNPKAQADFLNHDPLPAILSVLSPSVSSGSQMDEPPSSQTRSKAAYALSATLKHNAGALSRFGDIGGWDILRSALQDSDITIRRKIAFLINTLLLPTTPVASSSAVSNIPFLGPTIRTALPPNTSPSTAIAPHIESSSPEAGTLPPSLDPTSTSPLALEALRTHHIIPVLIDSLTTPLPHGPDADEGVDTDYAVKATRALITFLEVGGQLSAEETAQLCKVEREGQEPNNTEWDTLRRHVSVT